MIRVAIIADTTERAESIAEALEEDERFDVIGVYTEDDVESDPAQAADVTVIAGLAPEVREIAEPVVAITDAQPESLGLSGVRAWLPLGSSKDEIQAAVFAVAHGLIVLTREQGQQWIRAPVREMDGYLVEALTARELQVLRMLADGLANKEIAEELKISEHTAKFHVSQILGKLGVNSRAEAVAAGMRRGLVPV